MKEIMQLQCKNQWIISKMLDRIRSIALDPILICISRRPLPVQARQHYRVDVFPMDIFPMDVFPSERDLKIPLREMQGTKRLLKVKRSLTGRNPLTKKWKMKMRNLKSTTSS
jgi:hypothetical protein